MTRFTTLILLGLLAAIPLQGQQVHNLTILHVNDSHSNLLPMAPRNTSGEGSVGGIARAATIIHNERLGSDPVLTLHAGDVFIGDPMYNLLYDQPAELSLLALLGFDAMAVGNHEFDLTPMALLLGLSNTLGDTPPFPLLSANLDLSHEQVQPLQHYIKNAVIKEYAGLKVGIFGLTTPWTNHFSQPSPASVIEDPEQLMTLIGTEVATLRGQGCDVVICLSHMGFDLDVLIASTIPGIDVIVGGHDHKALATPVVVSDPMGGSTSIVQTAGFYRQMGRMKLTVQDGVVSVADYELLALDQSVEEDATVKAMIDGIAAEIEQVVPGLFSTPIAQCTADLSEEARDLMHAGAHDTHVGNLVADAFAAVTGADIGIQPGGSTAQPLYAGPILPVDVFRMIGYGFNETNGLGFRVVTLSLSGAALMMTLEATLADIESNDEMLMQVSSSLAYTYDPREAVGARLKTVLYNGAPLDPGATYTVASNELAATFLDILQIPYDNLAIFNDMTEFEVLLGYLMDLETVNANPLPGRVASLATVGLGEVLPPSPSNIALDAAPHPFTTQTAITVSLEQAATLDVIVHDMLGRAVSHIASGRYGQGRHTMLWNAPEAAPGLYFCIARDSDGGAVCMPLLKVR
ncbi:MAG: bifunctional metallophosphatase/5'-nucleotidase [Bacteroidia bacterium]|nr:bifunctional metallophosphatase/5'-nucleotidase [Bacteroidia bacterium]